ncbi:MAG TPA: MOSC domain-containing protein [bacterium]|nr:MOSC domain-containing protein [bacterium]
MATIEAICISTKKGRVKKPVRQAEFRENHGIVGDAHAGDWHRQVSLLPLESINMMREKIPNLTDGAFAENLITRGLDYSSVDIGTRLQLGEDIVLEVTQIGKECHTACVIRTMTGDCIMPREGVFARVIRGGELIPGNEVAVVGVLEHG